MRMLPLIVALGTIPLAPLSAQEKLFEASPSAIHEVVSGKRCTGNDLLIFGESQTGESGSYERVGRKPGAYQIGFGTILILRGKDLHSHVATVSVHDHLLFLSTETFHCEP